MVVGNLMVCSRRVLERLDILDGFGCLDGMKRVMIVMLDMMDR